MAIRRIALAFTLFTTISTVITVGFAYAEANIYAAGLELDEALSLGSRAEAAIIVNSRDALSQAETEGRTRAGVTWDGRNNGSRRLARKGHPHDRGHSQRSVIGESSGHGVTLNEVTVTEIPVAVGGDSNAMEGQTTWVEQKATVSGPEMVLGGEQSIPRDPWTWDGENSWEWDNPRTLYYEPVAGLGNRLRALASAVVMAKELGVGLKVIWRYEIPCDDCGNPGFNSTWPDLFSEPRLRLVDNFPGSNYTTKEELTYLRAKDRDDTMKPILPNQCYIHYPRSHHELEEVMQTGWKKIGDEDVLCVKSDLWLTEAGEKEGKFFFRLLKPSARVQSMIDRYKYESEWEENHMVGVHVRRGDLTIYDKNSAHQKMVDLLPLDDYITAMRKQKELASGIRRVRFFLATDDPEAEKQIKAAFPPGHVMSFQKQQYSRLAVEGIQEALVDVLLLADCPVLIGTYYSSYSETAKMMGWPFYIQIGQSLSKISVETVVEKADQEDRRRLMERWSE